MRFKILIAAVVMVVGLIGYVIAQEMLNASDLVDQIRSVMDLSFSQEDRIKPIVAEYVAGVNKIEAQGEGNEKVLRPQVQQLSQQFDQKLSQVFTSEQLNTWKTAKKQILPGESNEREGRERNEAGESNERGGR